jgi:cell division protein FtsA
MLNSNHLCCLDIGSTKIASCLARVKRREIQELFLETAPVKGVCGGTITDSLALTDCVSRVLKRLKEKSGCRIKSVALNISGSDVSARHSHAIIPLAEKGNKVITRSDINEANEQARILGSSLEEEILHVIPSGYAIDSKNNILNPVGLYSHRLEADLYLVLGKQSCIQSLGRVVRHAGADIRKIFFSGLATIKAARTEEGAQGLNVLCDIGGDITELLTFQGSLLKDVRTLSMGGDDITAALQEELKVPRELAEELKRSYGVIASAESIPQDKEILVKKSNLYNPIKQRTVVELVSAASRQLCQKIRAELLKIAQPHEIDGVAVCGRTIMLEGFIETIENSLSVPVRIARIRHPKLLNIAKTDPELSSPKHLAYLTCLGMLCDALEKEEFGLLPIANPAKSVLAKAALRFKEVYQEYF